MYHATASYRAVGYGHVGGLRTPNVRRYFSTRIHSNDPKITREYREDDDTVISAPSSSPESPPSDTSGQQQSQYVDELPEVRSCMYTKGRDTCDMTGVIHTILCRFLGLRCLML